MVKGIQKALENINSVLGPKIIGLDSRDEGKLTDCSLSGTGPITTNLRANAIFGVSLTLARASAHTANSLPYRTLADGRKPVMPLPHDERHKQAKSILEMICPFKNSW